MCQIESESWIDGRFVAFCTRKWLFTRTLPSEWGPLQRLIFQIIIPRTDNGERHLIEIIFFTDTYMRVCKKKASLECCPRRVITIFDERSSSVAESHACFATYLDIKIVLKLILIIDRSRVKRYIIKMVASSKKKSLIHIWKFLDSRNISVQNLNNNLKYDFWGWACVRPHRRDELIRLLHRPFASDVVGNAPHHSLGSQQFSEARWHVNPATLYTFYIRNRSDRGITINTHRIDP